jgi:uncharacterized protein (TIGR02246 family)
MNRLTALACAIATMGVCASASAQAPSTMTCTPITQPEVAALFDRWNASLATHDADKVTANYAPDAVLLATVSNQPRTNSAEIKDYFEHFLKRDPQGTIDTRTIRIGCNEAIDVGTYTFKCPVRLRARLMSLKRDIHSSTNRATESGSLCIITRPPCLSRSSRPAIRLRSSSIARMERSAIRGRRTPDQVRACFIRVEENYAAFCLPQSRADAMSAPSRNVLSLAQTKSSVTHSQPTKVPNPQSTPAMTLSRSPTALTTASMR